MNTYRDNRRYTKNSKSLFYGIVLWYALFVLSLFTVEALEASTWYVPSAISTIKQAVEVSASYGDTVLVAPGIYDTTSGESFPINMKNGVVLMSEAGAPTTIIDAQSTGRIFHCENCDSTTVIAGFTITNGSTTNGGGIFCIQSSLEIRENIIINNTVTNSGGGICCSSSDPRIVKNTIAHNTAMNAFGGGIYNYYCSSVLEHNTVTRNTARWGGGIFNDHSSPTITYNIIDRNHSVISGGGLDCYMNSSPEITANVIVGNSCGTNGAGIACCYDCYPLIMYNTIARNAGDYGGGVRSLGNSSPQIFLNSIVDNVDGIYLTTDSDIIQANGNNIYFNTYTRGDYEVVNNTASTINLTDNFWWIIDSSAIDSLINGPVDFVPFRNSSYENAPNEPVNITSLIAMSDSTYSTPLINNLDIGDTLYIQLEGDDWNSSLMEPALLIVTSNKDPYGIGVALIEIDTAAGVYRGFAVIDTVSDDAYNRIGAHSIDTLIIKANIDYTKCDTVVVDPTGITNGSTTSIRASKPRATIISGPLLLSEDKECKVYDISGRIVEPLQLRPGVYFIDIEGKPTQKVIKIR
ncbi:MAG: DUF1565 domain-containing protein [candidate division WOR-3 bacterium]|nr:MAG: DUF1565 domain-containing protein [candidate division WOR-3 bacterium]